MNNSINIGSGNNMNNGTKVSSSNNLNNSIKIDSSNKTNSFGIYKYIKTFLFFCIFFLGICLYCRTVVFDRASTQIVFQSLLFILFIVSAFKIKAGFYLFIFLLPLFNSLAPRIGVSRIDIIFYLFFGLFLGFLVNRFSREKHIIYETEILKPVIIFIILLSVSALITVFRYSNFYPFITTRFHDLVVNFAETRAAGSILWTIKYYFNYIAGLGLFFITFNAVRKEKDFFTVLRVIIFTTLVVITFGLYQRFFDISFLSNSFWVEAGRINSTLSDPNALGSYVVLLFPLFFSLIIFFNKWYFKILSMVFLAVFVFIGSLSGSRSAFLSIFISLLFFTVIGLSMLIRLLIKKKIRNLNKSAFFSALIIVLLILIMVGSFMGIFLKTGALEGIENRGSTGILLADRMIETIADYFSELKSEGFERAFIIISSGRDVLWRQAVYMLKDHPVSGVGTGAYFIELPDYHRRYHIGYHQLDFTGNYYLQILSELGIAGTILNLFIFFLIIKKSLNYFLNKNRYGMLKKNDWLLAGLFISFLSMVIALFFGSHTNFMEVQFLFWLMAGLIIAYIKINSTKVLKEEGNAVFKAGSILKTGNYRLIKFDRIAVVILIGLIVVFGGTLFKGSIADLSINVKQTYYGWDEYNNYGFYPEEKIEGENVRWAGIDASQVILNDRAKIAFSIKDHDPAGHRLPMFVRFYIDNWPVGIIKVDDKEWHDIEIDLSKYNKKKLTFTMSCSRGWVPRERGLSGDTRELGVLFREESKFIRDIID